MVLSLFVISCEDNDDNNSTPAIPGGSGSVELVQTQNEFVWRGLNLYYFWQQDTPNLADSRFNTLDEFYTFLNTYDDPETMFNEAPLRNQDDRFTFFNEDYRVLANAQQGVFKTNGLSFVLTRVTSGSSEIVGVVRYVNNNTDASSKDVARGDIFSAVNGTPLFFNSSEDNNLDLLDPDTYTLNFATIENGSAVSNGKNIEFTKVEQDINPILITKTFDIGGKSIGYLMYNRFTSNFDDELNTAFASLAGVDELILDMRYNPGGSVRSSVRLASMITGQFTGQLMLRQRYNDKLQEAFSEAQVTDNFVDNISGTSLNSLGLEKVYVIATDDTASASELVINGLRAYIDVIHVGTTTVGKNEFSITLVDDVDNQYIFDRTNTSGIAEGNLWAIQPLLGRNENADGFSDYTGGFSPNVTSEEALTNLGILGDENEPLLATALAQITGATIKGIRFVKDPIKPIMSSDHMTILKDDMYIDGDKIKDAMLEIKEN
ncbi:carboxyl-terminal protease [Spongiivirga citrea]|uniref:Carboxyl-terminal protease n=2 Tax=Spongiivirga citrea TaxID=1481457 RepID=A0A6M0CR11_9FLAO|nr:carboxyl-terminal protease [Spongiivirga citrea]